jgi:hypothetical protein
VINHGIEHRTNITTILAQLGIEPPEIWLGLHDGPPRSPGVLEDAGNEGNTS